MCEPASIGLALGASASSAAAVGTLAYLGAGSIASQVYQGEQARKAQNTAADQARTASDQQYNAANPKRPNSAAMADANKLAASGGAGSTMLTGPMGVDPASLTLGKNTLLGG